MSGFASSFFIAPDFMSPAAQVMISSKVF